VGCASASRTTVLSDNGLFPALASCFGPLARPVLRLRQRQQRALARDQRVTNPHSPTRNSSRKRERKNPSAFLLYGHLFRVSQSGRKDQAGSHPYVQRTMLLSNYLMICHASAPPKSFSVGPKRQNQTFLSCFVDGSCCFRNPLRSLLRPSLLLEGADRPFGVVCS
jgi:hypothetical protein